MAFRKRVNPSGSGRVAKTAAELSPGEEAILERIDLPEDVSLRLMELGFLPGNNIAPGRTAPGGGARVYRIDGSEIALRNDTADRLYLRTSPADEPASEMRK